LFMLRSFLIKIISEPQVKNKVRTIGSKEKPREAALPETL